MQRTKQSNAKNKAIQCRTVLGSAPPNKGNICINFNLQSLKQRKNSSNPTKKKTTSHLTKLQKKEEKMPFLISQNAIAKVLGCNNIDIRVQYLSYYLAKAKLSQRNIIAFMPFFPLFHTLFAMLFSLYLITYCFSTHSKIHENRVFTHRNTNVAEFMLINCHFVQKTTFSTVFEHGFKEYGDFQNINKENRRLPPYPSGIPSQKRNPKRQRRNLLFHKIIILIAYLSAT